MQSVLNGMTPLIANLLREGGSVPVVKMLLEAGADPMQADQRGGTPLHYSASKDNRKVSQLLLDYGANLEVMDNRGFTVLFAAANDGSFKTAGWLLRKVGAALYLYGFCDEWNVETLRWIVPT